MDKIIAGIIGLIAGTIGSLIAPWVHWGIEKRRIKQKRRIELIEKWRSILDNPNFERSGLLEDASYGTLRKLLKDDVKKEIERSPNKLTIVVGSPTRNHDKDLLLKEIARIEEEWDLI